MINPLDGHRVYNGCPDDTMQARINYETGRHRALLDFRPDAHLTYFPIEQRWLAHVWGIPLSEFCYTRLDAIEAAIATLRAS